MRRHKKNCLSRDLDAIRAAMEKARESVLAEIGMKEMEQTRADVKAEIAGSMAARFQNSKGLFDQFRILRERAANALDKAEATEDIKSILAAIREIREILRLWAELRGKLQVIVVRISSSEAITSLRNLTNSGHFAVGS